MNQDIQQQLQLLLGIDAICPKECVRILSICSQVLNTTNYILKLSSTLDPIFNDPTFDLVSEIAQIMLALVNMAQKCTYSSEIVTFRLKYVLWASLYYYLVNSQSDLLRMVDLGQIRLAFSNSFELLVVPVERVQIPQKTLCDSCLSCFGWSNKIHI